MHALKSITLFKVYHGHDLVLYSCQFYYYAILSHVNNNTLIPCLGESSCLSRHWDGYI